jgi:hypothetical protein
MSAITIVHPPLAATSSSCLRCTAAVSYGRTTTRKPLDNQRIEQGLALGELVIDRRLQAFLSSLRSEPRSRPRPRSCFAACGTWRVGVPRRQSCIGRSRWCGATGSCATALRPPRLPPATTGSAMTLPGLTALASITARRVAQPAVSRAAVHHRGVGHRPSARGLVPGRAGSSGSATLALPFVSRQLWVIVLAAIPAVIGTLAAIYARRVQTR